LTSRRRQAAAAEAYGFANPYPRSPVTRTGPIEPPPVPPSPLRPQELGLVGPSAINPLITERTTVSSIGHIAQTQDNQDEEIPDTPPLETQVPVDQDEDIPDAPEEPEEDPEDPDDEEEDDMPSKPTEINIGQPNDYDGTRENATRFLAQVTAYLDINDKIYDDDKKKVVFALSFMKTGTAATWMEDFINFAQEISPVSTHGAKMGYGTFEGFIQKFKNCFFPIDEPGTALHQLHNLRQKEDINEYTATFKQLCRKVGITNFAAQKDYYL
jgi:hypothetical protein